MKAPEITFTMPGAKIMLPACSNLNAGYRFEIKNPGPEVLTIEAESESFFLNPEEAGEFSIERVMLTEKDEAGDYKYRLAWFRTKGGNSPQRWVFPTPKVLKWSGQQDSNLRPSGPKADTLARVRCWNIRDLVAYKCGESAAAFRV